MHLDLRHLGEAKIDKKIPFVRELARSYAGIDPVHQPIPVRPVVHYVMGGIDTDGNAATNVPGLYAAGECACVSINGANRLGSNSLTELLVFGAQAGKHAARFAMDHPDYDVSALEAQAADEGARVRRTYFDASRKGERIVTLRTELHDAMEDGAGIYRDAGSLEATCATVTDLRERYRSVTLDDHTNSFNTELTAALGAGVAAGSRRGDGEFGASAHRVARFPTSEPTTPSAMTTTSSPTRWPSGRMAARRPGSTTSP